MTIADYPLSYFSSLIFILFLMLLPLFGIHFTESTSRFPRIFFGYIYEYPFLLDPFVLTFGDPMFTQISHLCFSFSLEVLASKFGYLHDCEVSDFWRVPRLYA
jgi:hypothetical protein